MRIVGSGMYACFLEHINMFSHLYSEVKACCGKGYSVRHFPMPIVLWKIRDISGNSSFYLDITYCREILQIAFRICNERELRAPRNRLLPELPV